MASPWDEFPTIEDGWDAFPVVEAPTAESPPASTSWLPPTTPRQLLESGQQMMSPPVDVQGFKRGLMDPIDAGAQMLPRAGEAITSLGGLAPNPVSEWFGREAESEDERIRREIAAYEAQRQDAGFDTARLAGNILNPANIAVASRLPQAAGLLKGGATAALGGAGLAAMQPVTDEDFAGTKAEQLKTGALLGPVARGGSEVVSRVIAPQIGKAAQMLRGEGVRLTPGQMAGDTARSVEDKLMSIPFLGGQIRQARNRGLQDLNRAAYNRALKPIGLSADDLPAGPEGVATVRQALNAAYDDVLPNLTFRPDAQLQKELAKIDKMVRLLPKSEKRQFDILVKEELTDKATPQGRMLGETYKEAESQLRRYSDQFMSSSDANQRNLGEALEETLQALRRSLARANPEYAPRLNKISRGWANYTRLREAASKLTDQSSGFTPAQLDAAVRKGDKSVGKRAFSEGTALMQDLSAPARSLLGPGFQNSGTADRLLLPGLALAGMGAGESMGIDPKLAALVGLPALMYSRPGMAAANLAMMSRPESAKAIAEVVRKSSPVIAGALSPSF